MIHFPKDNDLPTSYSISLISSDDSGSSWTGKSSVTDENSVVVVDISSLPRRTLWDLLVFRKLDCKNVSVSSITEIS